MKKIPYGISNYEKLITENYYYVDKTIYIEKLENMNNTNIMCLRPRRFGKSLFTSTLELYYDINSKDKFDTLFGDTYIGKNPTKLKNSYFILRFDFSGINTKDLDLTLSGFRENVIDGINKFIVKYDFKYNINDDLSTEGLLNNFFTEFERIFKNNKLYVIIDEYDQFANELLSFKFEDFKDMVSRNGEIRKWFEVLKKGTFTVVDRIFMTGVQPITLDALTSGFNIMTDITRDLRFNELFGFNKDELVIMMKSLEISDEEIKNILPIMKENYNGYKFNEDSDITVYNPLLCLSFIDHYVSFKDVPKELMDSNIVSDYNKLSRMLNLCMGDNIKTILELLNKGECVQSRIINSFNLEMDFGVTEFISMLFYVGYLTIDGWDDGEYLLKIPNKVMESVYRDYINGTFIDVYGSRMDYKEIEKEIIETGKIDKLIELLHSFLNRISNRDYVKFDEKYIKLACMFIVNNFKNFDVISEPEINKKYPDLLLLSSTNNILIEFKYLKKEDISLLEEKKKEAYNQIIEYSKLDRIKNIKNIKYYTVVAVNDELYVDNITIVF